jgi:ion channel-forming bestrophin family protein
VLINRGISIFYFLRLIKWDALAMFLFAVLTGAFDNHPLLKNIEIPFGLSALVGTLLSLLLAFRTSQSYERWWEARTIWGAIVNDSRTLIRQLIEFVPPGADKAAFVQSFAVRQSMWCYALANTLRKLDMPPPVKVYCKDRQLQSDNLPNLLLTKHAEELAQLAAHYNLNANMQMQVSSTLQRLTDSMGKCERIKNTVFPRSYSLLIHFLIYVFMTIMPFGLVHNNPWVEVLLVTFVPVLFISIERTAILMQDPFENRPTDVPMTSLSETIERNLLEMAQMPEVHKVSQAADYYVM